MNKDKRSYEFSAVPPKIVIGILLIAVGGLSLLALLMGVDGALFGALKPALNGIAGCFAWMLAGLFVWAGILMVISSSRAVSFRGMLLTGLVYFLLLNLLNLLSRVGQQGFFVDYCIAAGGEAEASNGYLSAVSEAYRFCSRAGEPGGALGMLIAYPLHRTLGIAFGALLLIAAIIALVLWLTHFNLNERVESIKSFIAGLQEKQALRRAQQEQQQRLWEQEMAQNPEQLQQHGYKRSMGFRKEQAAAQAMFATQLNQPQENVQPQQQAAQPAPLRPAPSADLPLYDEVIDPGVSEPHEAQVTMQDARVAASQSEFEEQRKTIDRLEGKRRNKAEVLRHFSESIKNKPQKAEEISSESAPASVAESDPEEKSAAGEENVVRSEAEYHPLIDAEKETETDDIPEETPRMPESNLMHTPMFAPLMGMTPVEKPEPAEEFQPLIDDEDEPDSEPESATEAEPEPPRPYVYPPVDLLNLEQYKVKDTQAADQENAAKLVETLSSFGIPAKVQHVTHGPAITRFAMGLTASGINVKRIQNITDNIALELAADGAIRIESQIPGTNLFGIEVPNKEIQTVTFAQVLLSPEMQAAKSPLAVGLGHDITGKPVICDLAKMPHLLIAGQTGSGKSVCVNAIINSLLFRASPEDVRMIMIDPKVVELQCYNVVPHLLIPVVTDTQKAAGALAWAVAEMEDRYNKMHTKNVRELNAYNAKLGPDEPKLPRIVVIIDELADLMMASKHEVEESIIRLAQKARAAGIHMVIATQRPTVDVITGLIKSNVPSRIAFSVSSSIDSRTILDKNGAEKLLGRGDMLYMPTGIKSPVRVQGCYLGDEEIERVVNYIETYSKVEFDPNVLEAVERQENGGDDAFDDGGCDDGVDERLQEAIEMVVTDGQASISMLQRRMKIGYARAGRLIDDMAARGIVSKSLGSKPREVLITREEYERIKDSLLD